MGQLQYSGFIAEVASAIEAMESNCYSLAILMESNNLKISYAFIVKNSNNLKQFEII